MFAPGRLAWSGGAAILASAFAFQAAAGQHLPPVVTLRAVYRIADSASPAVRGAHAAARAAEFRVPAATRLPDPMIQLQLMNRNLPGLGLNDPLGMNQVQLTQTFPAPGKLRLAGDVAVAKADAARESVAEVTWSRRASAAMAFFELHRLDATLAITRETLHLLEGIGVSTAQMYAVGQSRQTDVLRAQLEVNRMTGEVEDLIRMRAAMAARLNAVLNRPATDSVGPTELPRLPEQLPSTDSLIDRALTSRGMIRSAVADLRAAAANERLARREIWPDLEVGVVYGQRGMPDGTTDRMVSLMLGATIPIWANSRQYRLRDEAAAMREMAAASLDALRAETGGRIAELVAQHAGTMRLRTLYARSILPQAEATARSARDAYQAGTVDFMTMLDALMVVNTYRAKLQQLDADAGSALAELEMITGSSLIPDDPYHGLAGGEGTR